MQDVHRPLIACLARSRLPWIILAVVLLATTTAFADDGGLKADVTTCLLRPRHLVQLGSPVFGLLTGVFVDRAEPVKQGQVVAKLDTTVEEMQLALDRFRSTNTALVEAAQADLAWNQRELARRQQLAGNMFSKANDIDEYATKVDAGPYRHPQGPIRPRRRPAARPIAPRPSST